MISYLSQKGMERVFSQWADADPNISSFGFGQFYTPNGEPKASQKYPGIWVQPTLTQVDEYVVNRTYQIMIYDLHYINENGESNQNAVVSDCEEYAFRLIRFLKKKSDIFNIITQPTITPMSDRFVDDVTGVILDLTVEFTAESSACDDPDYSFDITKNSIR